MSSNENKHTYWDDRRNVFRTKKGGWVIGEAVYNHGYSMMDDLVGAKSFFQVLVLNITGRMPEKKIADWLEASFICLSWPDPRIWCNKMGMFAGGMQCTPVAGVSMGILASDSRMYGPGALRAGANFISQALIDNSNGISVQEVISRELRRKSQNKKTKPYIMGYARPIATGDERIPAMERVSKALGFDTGAHLSLAYKIDKLLAQDYDEGMNMLGYCVAFLSDQNFTADEIYRIYSAWVNSGVHACYSEARDKTPWSILPLHCGDVEYHGKSKRNVPNKNDRQYVQE